MNSLSAVTNQPTQQFASNQFPLPPVAGQYLVPPPVASPVPGLMPGHGLIRVNIQGSTMTSSRIVPSLLVDGRLLASRYGVNAFQVPPGRHRIELYAQWMRRYGQAMIEVEVPLGGAVEVFYAAPLHQFATGNIGYTKQPRPGVLFMVAMLAIVFGMVAAGITLAMTLG